jgi:hypothetical protein
MMNNTGIAGASSPEEWIAIDEYGKATEGLS